MAKYTPLNSLPGVTDLRSLLEIMREPDRYETMLDEIDAHYERANKAVETVGTANRIRALHDEAQNDRQRAQEALDAAHKEAESILAEARAKSVELEGQARALAERDRMLAKAKDAWAKEEQAERAELARQGEAAEAAKAEAVKASEAAAAALAEANARKEQYDEMIKNIERATGRRVA